MKRINTHHAQNAHLDRVPFGRGRLAWGMVTNDLGPDPSAAIAFATGKTTIWLLAHHPRHHAPAPSVAAPQLAD